MLDVTTPVLRTLVIEGTLEVHDRGEGTAPLLLQAEHIVIRKHGALLVGSPSQPYRGNFEIRMVGDRHRPAFLNGFNTFAPSKAITSNGNLTMVGISRRPSWTRLLRPARAGDTEVVVMGQAQLWRAGDRIVFGPTGFRHNETEEAIVRSVTRRSLVVADAGGSSVIGFGPAVAALGTTGADRAGSGLTAFEAVVELTAPLAMDHDVIDDSPGPAGAASRGVFGPGDPWSSGSPDVVAWSSGEDDAVQTVGRLHALADASDEAFSSRPKALAGGSEAAEAGESPRGAELRARAAADGGHGWMAGHRPFYDGMISERRFRPAAEVAVLTRNIRIVGIDPPIQARFFTTDVTPQEESRYGVKVQIRDDQDEVCTGYLDNGRGVLRDVAMEKCGHGAAAIVNGEGPCLTFDMVKNHGPAPAPAS